MARAGRPPNPDRTKVVSATGVQVPVRLTLEERGWLDKLVELRRAKADGATVSAASVIRGLIRREAIARGLVEKPKSGSR